MGLNGAFLTGRPFQPVCVLRGPARGLVWAAAARRRRTAGEAAACITSPSISTASFLFLIGVALIYGMAGTLNMADLAGRAAALAPHDRALLDAGAAILGIAFLIKAASWPLNFWLPGAYSVALAPVAAAFAMMTKVGFYAVLRLEHA